MARDVAQRPKSPEDKLAPVISAVEGMTISPDTPIDIRDYVEEDDEADAEKFLEWEYEDLTQESVYEWYRHFATPTPPPFSPNMVSQEARASLQDAINGVDMSTGEGK